MYPFAVEPAVSTRHFPRTAELDHQVKGGWKMPLGEHFVEELSHALRQRHIAEGVAMLDRVEADLARLEPTDAQAPCILLLIAQWVDVGYKDHCLLDSLLQRFPAKSGKKLPLEDYLRIRMVEAFRALSIEEVDTAISILEFALKAEQELEDDELLALAHFWKGRAHRKKGEYEIALQDITCARELAQKRHGEGKLTAVIQIQESWLLFQRGMRKEAWHLLAHAEAVLKSTDHYLALGNIESARGRIVRRSGEYAKALEHFDRAVEIYSKGNPNHPNVARTLVNSAYVKRLLALQLRKKIDARARRPERGRTEADAKARSVHHSNLRTRYLDICHEAILQLRRAKEIYALHGHARGIGAVMLNTSYLHLDRGDIDKAAAEASEAYRMGAERGDLILMARTRILQAAIENTRVEEQLGEDVDTAVHANKAKQYCEEALTLAQQTQNRRLLAGAYVASGMTAANDFFQDWEWAKKCASGATGLIDPSENDYLADDLAALKSQIIQASGINDTLRVWSEGLLGNKTFQQVTEEFAEIVIPKVWMREGKKVARVAECLSISPKKVRRILRNAGFLSRDQLH